MSYLRRTHTFTGDAYPARDGRVDWSHPERMHAACRLLWKDRGVAYIDNGESGTARKHYAVIDLDGLQVADEVAVV